MCDRFEQPTGETLAPGPNANLNVDRPEAYLLIHNIKSKQNIGNIMRSCVAFGVKVPTWCYHVCLLYESLGNATQDIHEHHCHVYVRCLQ